VSAYAAKLDRLGSKVRSDLPGTWNAVWMRLATTFHLTEMVGRVKELSGLLPGMHKYTEADEIGMQLRTQVNTEIEQVLRPLNAYFAKLKNREQVDARMQELAGEASILGIDLTKNFDENRAAFNKTLDPMLKQRVNARAVQTAASGCTADITARGAGWSQTYIQHSANVLKTNITATREATDVGYCKAHAQYP
jgi:hypothetical protein